MGDPPSLGHGSPLPAWIEGSVRIGFGSAFETVGRSGGSGGASGVSTGRADLLTGRVENRFTLRLLLFLADRWGVTSDGSGTAVVDLALGIQGTFIASGDASCPVDDVRGFGRGRE